MKIKINNLDDVLGKLEEVDGFPVIKEKKELTATQYVRKNEPPDNLHRWFTEGTNHKPSSVEIFRELADLTEEGFLVINRTEEEPEYYFNISDAEELYELFTALIRFGPLSVYPAGAESVREVYVNRD